MMPSARRRFMLADPCLVAAGSHPLHFAAEVLAAAARAGCDCSLLANRSCAAGLHADVWPARPTFTNTAYSKYTAAGGLDRLDARGRSGWLPWPPWESRHAARRREERIAVFARELAPALAELRSGDLFLLATTSELEIAGLARAIAAARPVPEIAWHALLHFPLYRGFAADHGRQDRRLDWARLLLQAAGAAVPGLRLHATTAELAALYVRLTGLSVDVLPYPIQRIDLQAAVGPARERGVVRVSCLGDARPEKGSHTLPAIVAAAAADPLLAGVRFTVQTNIGFDARSRAAEHRAVVRALEALGRQAAAGGPVDLVPGPLAGDAYARALAVTDVMLLPYDQERYRVRCSGIVLEALASGAVPLVTGGGWMARQLAEPLRLHAATVTARAEVRYEQRIEAAPLVGGRSMVVDVPADGQRPEAGRQEFVTVTIHWRPEAGVADPPLRVACLSRDRHPATLLAADGGGLPDTAIFPGVAGGSGPWRVTIAAPWGGSAAVEAIVVRRLVGAGPVPAGAVGAVVAATDDVVPALRELVRHVHHYRETAERQAAAVREAACGAAVIRRLLP